MSESENNYTPHGLIDIDEVVTDEVYQEFVYVTVPREYIALYHKILLLLADFGEEMLNDCKSACKDRNSQISECYNMFNAAIAARKLNEKPLEHAIITYLEAKLEMIYKELPNTSFIWDVDDRGLLKAIVDGSKNPKLYINPDDGYLYEEYVTQCHDNGYAVLDDVNNESN